MQLIGSICALVTPFRGDGALDLDTLDALLDWHLQAGTAGLVLGGSTGESGALESDELVALLARARARVGTRLPLWAGVGAASTARALRLGREAAAAGADALLAVTPYYCRPTQDGLHAHYMALADQLAVPVVLYNVPPRTGVDLLPATVAGLATHERIIGIKEAVPSNERLQALLPLRRADFSLWSGDDAACAEWMLAGADGVVSVVANAIPQQFAQLALLARSDAAACRRLEARLQPLIAALAVAPNPIAIKALLALLGRCGPTLRLPLTELSPHHHAALRNAHEQALSQ